MVDNNQKNFQWGVLTLRLTAFISPNSSFDPLSTSWWEHVAQNQFEASEKNNNFIQKVEIGKYKDATLICEMQPGRVDWRLTTIPVGQVVPISANDFRPVEGFLSMFSEVISRWFEVSPLTIRLAFGAQLGIPVVDRVTGYNTISKYLKSVTLDVDNSRDLLFQINRPRMSKVVSQLLINRLSRWSVTVFMRAFGVPPGMENLMPPTAFQQQLNASFVDLDINTAAENSQEFNKDDLLKIFDELKETALEIALEGDIP